MDSIEFCSDELSDVSATSLITLYGRALESQSKEPIIHDPKAVEITKRLSPELAKSKNRLYRNLANGKLDKKLMVHIALRSQRYDQYAKEFLKHSPDGIVVNIGCGLDTRFFRIDDGHVNVYDLDFPSVINLKRQFLAENDRYHFIPSSALDFDWMHSLQRFADRSFLFLAEGIFMYLQPDDVNSLVLTLQSRFPGAHLVCEVFNSFWLKKSLKWMINIKLQRELHLGKDATFNFGIRDGRDLESWSDGIKFLDEWSYLDSTEKKLGALKLFRHINLVRKTQWTAHYQLHPGGAISV